MIYIYTHYAIQYFNAVKYYIYVILILHTVNEPMNSNVRKLDIRHKLAKISQWIRSSCKPLGNSGTVGTDSDEMLWE